jgi:ribonuclease-3
MGMTSNEKKHLKAFEKKLGFKFKSKGHLKRALTHKSYANENRLPPTDQNERYEYLGDAVLELAISHLLMKKFPEYSEGELSKLRAAIVNESRLASIAKRLELGDYLYLGRGEEITGGRNKDSVLSDAFEAVLGSVYLDKGFNKAMGVVGKHFKEVLVRSSERGFVKDFKTRLQEKAQGKLRAMPRYRLVREKGPDHRKTFEVHLYINEELMGVGTGGSKKAAEQEAARAALEKLEGAS